MYNECVNVFQMRHVPEGGRATRHEMHAHFVCIVHTYNMHIDMLFWCFCPPFLLRRFTVYPDIFINDCLFRSQQGFEKQTIISFDSMVNSSGSAGSAATPSLSPAPTS